jgi:hypothetical protein
VSARLLVFDIETRPTSRLKALERAMDAARNADPPSSMKAADKLTWDMEDEREKRAAAVLSGTMVDVAAAELLVVAWRADGHAWAGTARNVEEEKRLLELVVESWNECLGPETVIAGHNIKGFDLPVLLNRLRYHDVPPPKHFPVYRRGYWTGSVYDTMEGIPSKTPFISLESACARYGLGSAKNVHWNGAPMTGARVLEAFQAGAWEVLTEYCCADVEAEERLYLRMTAGDTWGTYNRGSELVKSLAAIEISDMTPEQKTVAAGMLVRGERRLKELEGVAV